MNRCYIQGGDNTIKPKYSSLHAKFYQDLPMGLEGVTGQTDSQTDKHP